MKVFPSRRILKGSLLVISMLVFVFSTILATKPGEDVNPNGFPSGEHYNLNIIGKKLEFTCPEVVLDADGNPIYGNVIYVPENGEGIQILMQSGKKGKKAEEITELRVTDPCTALFDGDAAVLQLPKNEYGYDVYARALAKPTDNPYLIVSPELIAVEDEAGNDLIWLGLVTDNGFYTPQVTFTRNKGKSIAIDITGLFLWSGVVCYLTEDPAYCDPCTPTQFCAVDLDGDGVFDHYVQKVEGEECPTGYTDVVTAYCKTYDFPTWVFNIGDFVTYLWSIENHGLKLLQVRFYPRTE